VVRCIRGAVSVKGANNPLDANREIDNEDEQIPPTFDMYERVFRCTHGPLQKSRGRGKREQRIRFTGCDARFTGRVKQVQGVWCVVVVNEVRPCLNPCPNSLISNHNFAVKYTTAPHAQPHHQPDSVRLVHWCEDCRVECWYPRRYRGATRRERKYAAHHTIRIGPAL